MRRTLVFALAVAAAGVAVAASTAARPHAHGTAARAAAACGTVPTVAPNDPQHLTAKLPRAVRQVYNGYSTRIQASAWAHWKPKHKGPYTVGLVMDALANPDQTAHYNDQIAALKKSKLVKKVIAVSSKTGGDAAGELQLYQSVIQQGADIVLLQPTSPPAFVSAIAAAAKKGIPTIVSNSPVDSPYVVNVVPNAYTGPAIALSNILRQMNGKGNLLEVHGIPSTSVDQTTFQTFDKVLANCPDVKVVGEVDGMFAPPVVQSAVLQWLATHPGQVDVVAQTAVMAPAIMQAFQQAGRKVPNVVDDVAQQGSVAYWAQNASKGYKGAGFAGGEGDFTNLSTRIVERMLVGQGPKLNTIIWSQPQITQGNLSKFVDPSWTLNTPGNVEPPPSAYTKDSTLDALFTNPSISTK
ncbi:MAG TPA: substrate-binding domain-containing protein [Gaiellaceae bacterium]|jgi:ribose transport system substrate-binding protein|nr:substrate-binding domain-containing protein [Gaiellaceae bacterium]